MTVIRQDDLPWSAIAHEFVGEDHDGVGLCILFVDAAPGQGPGLHKHPYDEVFIVQEGRGMFILGEEEVEVGVGEIVVARADTPHRFVNTGDSPLRQVDIHVSASFATEWL